MAVAINGIVNAISVNLILYDKSGRFIKNIYDIVDIIGINANQRFLSRTYIKKTEDNNKIENTVFSIFDIPIVAF